MIGLRPDSTRADLTSADNANRTNSFLNLFIEKRVNYPVKARVPSWVDSDDMVGSDGRIC